MGRLVCQSVWDEKIVILLSFMKISQTCCFSILCLNTRPYELLHEKTCFLHLQTTKVLCICKQQKVQICYAADQADEPLCCLLLSSHGVQRKMISVDDFFVFLRLLFFAVLLLYVT